MNVGMNESIVPISVQWLDSDDVRQIKNQVFVERTIQYRTQNRNQIGLSILYILFMSSVFPSFKDGKMNNKIWKIQTYVHSVSNKLMNYVNVTYSRV